MVFFQYLEYAHVRGAFRAAAAEHDTHLRPLGGGGKCQEKQDGKGKETFH